VGFGTAASKIMQAVEAYGRFAAIKPIIKFFDLTSENVVGVVTYGYIILMSVLIHLFVERPFEKIRAHFRSKNKQAV
jgi:hypothetical protein